MEFQITVQVAADAVPDPNAIAQGIPRAFAALSPGPITVKSVHVTMTPQGFIAPLDQTPPPTA